MIKLIKAYTILVVAVTANIAFEKIIPSNTQQHVKIISEYGNKYSIECKDVWDKCH